LPMVALAAAKLPTIFDVGIDLGHVEVRHDLPEPKEFFDEYVKGWRGHPSEKKGKWKAPHGRPVLLKGAAKRMPAFKKWATDELLLKAYGKVKLDQVETEKVETRTKYPHDNWTLEKFLNNYNKSDLYSTATPPKKLQEDLYFLPSFNCGGFLKKIKSSVLWFSSGDTQSVIHNDGGHNHYCNFAGRKRWILWHPTLHTMSKDLGWANGEEEAQTNPAFENTYGSWYAVDYNAVDLKKYPGWKKMEFYTMDMEAGDCAFLPHQWMHHVQTLPGRSIAVHVWVDMPKKFDESSCQKLKDAGANISDLLFQLSDCKLGYGDPDIRPPVKQTGCKLSRRMLKQEL